MNRLRLIFSFLTILAFFPAQKSVAQTTERLSDSLVYSIEMYKELYKEYNNVKQACMLNCAAVVAETFGIVASADDFTDTDFNNGVVNLNTKLVEDLNADLVSIFDLSEVIKQRIGVTIPEEQVIGLSTVGDIYNIVRQGDTIMLAMAYYPWRTVFDSRSVHRVSVYEDGIVILSDLVKLTTDSIQREIYLDELMNVYDVWYEHADTINGLLNIPISKTQIRSEKARKYIECMPEVYGVSKDSITKANIMEPFAVRAYNLLRDALYEQEHKEDLHHTIPLFYFPLTQSRIAYHHTNKSTKNFEKQYHADFDSVEIRLGHLLALEEMDEKIRKGNIRRNYDNIKKSYNETCDMMDLGNATNWRELETVYRNQLAEKRELWDFGVEVPDADFLDRIIRSIRNDSSEVRLEALECYVEYIVPRPAKSESVKEDKVEEYKKKRNSLVNVYLKRERYDDAYPLLEDIIKIETNNVEKAHLYYKRGAIQEKKKNYQSAASNYKVAVKLNPRFGDVLYKLALAYANCKFSNNKDKDKLKYNLVVEVLQKAKKSIITYANSAELGKYNTVSISNIEEQIAYFQTQYIHIEDFHACSEKDWPSKKNAKIGERYVYDEGVMRGESAIFNVSYEKYR